MLSPRQRLLAYALLTPAIAGGALFLLFLLTPPRRPIPWQAWALGYCFGVLGALGGSAVSRIEKGELARLKSSLPMLKNNIAWCLVELGADPPRALALATECAAWAAKEQKAQVRGMVSSTLGAAQLRNGEYGTAIETLRESLALTTYPAGRSSILYHLAEALQAAGRAEEAKSSYRESRDADPESRHGKLAAERLAAT